MNFHLVSKINRRGVLLIMMCFLAFRWPGTEAKAGDLEPSSAQAGAGQQAAAAGPVEGGGADVAVSEYHTPLAGEPFHTVFMGEKIDVPVQDRAHVTALTLGGTFYSPKQGDTAYAPIAALYVKRVWEDSRTRDVISIFVNDLEYDKSFGNAELVCRFENDTIPGGQTEVMNNQELKSTSLEWGTLFASFGPGFRYPVAPFQVDNDLRVQLLGRLGYFYDRRTSDTAPNELIPPDTMVYGAKLRGRYDGMRRNILELPHNGFAAGFDLDSMHRDRWSGSATSLTGVNTRDYLQFSGYVMDVAGIPGMSEKNRVIVSFYGATADTKSVDRFNAFRIGGGPIPGETDDLSRPDYPGTMFNEILVSDYALANLEYRRELTFFLYLHLQSSFIWANQMALSDADQVIFKGRDGEAFTVGLDTGFLWNSEIYLAYSWDSGFIRNGRSGSGLIFTWNKSL
jgi:hypothetical protein